MTIFQGFILGLVQGITEFLPISSSGHLALFQQYFGLHDSIITFDIWIHVATLIAMVIFFTREILGLNPRLLKSLFVASLPAAVVGVLAKDYIELALGSSLIVGFELMITGAVNLWTDRRLNKGDDLVPGQYPPTLKQSLLIGVAQAIAIAPGISRSGSTVAGAIGMGLKRQDAFNFSFLLGMIAIGGAAFLEALDPRHTNEWGIFLSAPYLVGFAASLIAGLASLAFFKYVINRAKLEVFGWYCIVLGGLAVGLALFR